MNARSNLYFCDALFYDNPCNLNAIKEYQMIDKVMANRAAMIVISVSLAIGAVVSIAAGFLITYRIVTYVGT